MSCGAGCGCAAGCASRAALNKARHAMCHTCPAKGWCPVFQNLTVLGRFVSAKEDICPRGRWPEGEEGIVRWHGVVAIGVPWLLRLRIGVEAAWEALRERLAPGFLPGCGCIRWFKERSELGRKWFDSLSGGLIGSSRMKVKIVGWLGIAVAVAGACLLSRPLGVILGGVALWAIAARAAAAARDDQEKREAQASGIVELRGKVKAMEAELAALKARPSTVAPPVPPGPR